MGQIRASVLITRNINKYRTEFPVLFAAYKEQDAKRKAENKLTGFKRHLKDSWIFVSDEAYAEYMTMVKTYLTNQRPPNNDRDVQITTHNGGVCAGFYQNGKWLYTTAVDTIRDVNGIVIRWEKSTY